MQRRPLVVGVDGSAESVLALGEAVHLAEERRGGGGFDLVVVFVRASSAMSFVVGAGAGVEQALDQMEAEVRRLAGDALWGRQLSWRLEVRSGDPAHELEQVARQIGAQMIVVGGHRHNSLASAVTKAVNAELVHGFNGSLLIIRPPVTDPDTADDRGVAAVLGDPPAPVGSAS